MTIVRRSLAAAGALLLAGCATGGPGNPLFAGADPHAIAIGSEVGRRVIRGVLGSIFGGKR